MSPGFPIQTQILGVSKGKENMCIVCVDNLSAAVVMIYHEVI